MSNATLAMSALAASLATVAPVRVARSALETTSATLPIITIWSLSDQLAADQDYDYPAFTRRAVVELKVAAGADYPSALDAGLSALRGHLAADLTGGYLGGFALALRQSGATFYQPADNGEFAVLQIQFEFDYL